MQLAMLSVHRMSTNAKDVPFNDCVIVIVIISYLSQKERWLTD